MYVELPEKKLNVHIIQGAAQYAHPLGGNVSVNLCGLGTCIPQQALYIAQVDTGLQQMGGKAMQ